MVALESNWLSVIRRPTNAGKSQQLFLILINNKYNIITVLNSNLRICSDGGFTVQFMLYAISIIGGNKKLTQFNLHLVH